MEITPFRIEHTDALVALWHRAGLVRPWNNPHRDIARKLTTGADLFLVGEIDGYLMASIMGGYEGHRGWVNYLAVDDGYRKQGHARRLVEQLEALLKARGCPKLNLQIRQTNVEVIEFYRHLGYQPDQAISLGKRLIPDQ